MIFHKEGVQDINIMVKSFNKWTAKMKSVEHLSILNKNVKQNILKNIYNLQQQKDLSFYLKLADNWHLTRC